MITPAVVSATADLAAALERLDAVPRRLTTLEGRAAIMDSRSMVIVTARRVLAALEAAGLTTDRASNVA